jgi:hypothetical protein
MKPMQQGKQPGPLGICVQDILYWHHNHPEIWDEFVLLVQVCFDGKPLPQELSYEILCLIPKSKCGKYHGIVLFEVIYKVISTIILMCIEDQVKFHTGIHGHWAFVFKIYYIGITNIQKFGMNLFYWFKFVSMASLYLKSFHMKSCA